MSRSTDAPPLRRPDRELHDIIDTTTAHATHARPALHATADSGPNEGHLPS
ncbi:hypothetical protein [Plantibacter sp. CFBP 8775]|uniref:hypothetical protein n=1 Tax=Plantibacter sp. CFBP 8775 TaxID=2774038 RepID=UPI001782F384|nr:hypothetical protein [Plantibacter sp. CFBP 8775]MBD8104091.1 hypothetical protein [Plantibacter sp. CFBP 8775]